MKELEEQIGYILYKACTSCTDDGLCDGTMELRRRIMDKVSQEKEKWVSIMEEAINKDMEYAARHKQMYSAEAHKKLKILKNK